MTIRCAIYARYSSDLQRPTSIEDQVRQCRDYAARRGWTVVEEFVRFDKEITAASLAGRDALQTLIEAAKKTPKPFDRLLVDDSSRLARNLEDALRTEAILRFNEVYVVYVSQGFDSEQKSARQLLTLHGLMDEQYLVGLADKVHRGQEGRVLKGLLAGGRCFGYRNVPIEDPTKQGKYGRPTVIGVRQEIDETQAVIVHRVFRMYADGESLASIAKKLNAEGILAPQPPRTRKLRAWCTSSIYEMLRNERYRGVQVWNRTRKERNPETGRKTSRPRPQSEWQRVDVPEWRIISEDLWEESRRRIESKKKLFASKNCSGVRRNASAQYLFSGLLVCGICGSRLVIAAGDGKRAYKKYGCPSHRYRGTCSNSLMIRQDRLEEQLLSYLQEQVLTSQMIDYTVQQFEKALQQRLATIQENAEKHSTESLKLQQQKTALQDEAANIVAAIGQMGHSPTLLSRLAALEREIVLTSQRIDEHKAPEISVRVEEIRRFVANNLADIRGLLKDQPAKVKQELTKQIGSLTLMPKTTPNGSIYEVSGNWNLLPSEGVIELVARDGFVQHYTPFGIPASGILLNPKSDLTTSVARC